MKISNKKVMNGVHSVFAVAAGLIIAADLGLSTANAQFVNNSEIWVSPYGTNYTTITGSGTIIDPYCTPTADLFYTLIRGPVCSSPNMVIHLMPGVFYLEADSSGSCILPMNGWKIRGAGMDVTILQIITNHPAVSQRKIYSIGSGNASKVEVSDLTFDCNLQNQSQLLCIEGAWLNGSDDIINRCRGINWGSTAPGAECFVFSLGACYATDTGGVIENCIVEQPAAVTHACNTTAILCSGWSFPNPTPGWVIRGCSVRNIGGSGVNIHAYATAGQGVEIYNNSAFNLTNGGAFYTDTGNLKDVIIHDNVFLNVMYGVSVPFPNYTWTNVAFVNNIITVQDYGVGIGIDLPPTGVTFKAIRIEGNIIKPYYSGGHCTPLEISPYTPSTMEISCNNNIFESGGAKDFLSTDIHSSSYFLQNVNFLSFKNNHNLSGTPLSMSDYEIWDYKFTGDYDVDLSFTPTTNGWYKIFSCPGFNTPCSGRVNIWSVNRQYNNIDIGLDFELIAQGNGILHQMYNDAQNDWNLIPQVRLAEYSTMNEEGFEIYVNSALVGQQVNLRVSGMNRPALYPNPICPGPAPSTQSVNSAYSVTLNIGP